jgi:hypothetical protein
MRFVPSARKWAGAPSTIVGRHATLADIEPGHAEHVAYTEGPSYDAVSLGANTQPVERNSVVLLPELLTPDECEAIVADVEAAHEQRADENPGASKLPHQRYMVPDLPDTTQRIFRVAMHERLLPWVSRALPSVVDMVWKRSQVEPTGDALCDCPLVFSVNEPAVNRYASGGRFEPHTDKMSLTLNVLLREGAFDGGGTQFWCEDDLDGTMAILGWDDGAAPTLRVEPGAGVGVVFNGTVKHAGRVVTGGVRHVLVASLSIAKGAAEGADALGSVERVPSRLSA